MQTEYKPTETDLVEAEAAFALATIEALAIRAVAYPKTYSGHRAYIKEELARISRIIGGQ